MKCLFCLLVIIFSVFITGIVDAKVKLPAFFTNNMVLQQQSEVLFWGEASKNEKVKISPSWSNKTYETIAEFSSVAYFFGKNLFMSNNIPIGLISSSWGGTIAEAWTSAKSLKTMPDFSSQVKSLEKSNVTIDETKLTYEKELADWEHKI